MSSTVKSVAYVHTVDIDPSLVKKGAVWEELANICVTAAEKALERPPPGYTATQRNSLTDIFASMKVTHRSIRLLVALGDEKPESVDALVLARLQLEGLYTMCLLIEKAKHVDRFVKEAWKRQYVSYLLMREETKSLDRFIEAQSDVLELSRLLKLAAVWNVTEPERLTIEYEELETPPAGSSSASRFAIFRRRASSSRSFRLDRSARCSSASILSTRTSARTHTADRSPGSIKRCSTAARLSPRCSQWPTSRRRSRSGSRRTVKCIAS